MRQQIVDKIETAIKSISSTEYSYEKYSRWQNTDTQYEKNHLDIRDADEKGSRGNEWYDTSLIVEITAILWGSSTKNAEELGTLALADLIEAVRNLSLPGSGLIGNFSSYKLVETKGKPNCQIELELTINYKL